MEECKKSFCPLFLTDFCLECDLGEKMKLYVESKNGHDEFDVPKEDMPNTINEAVKNDEKWATIDKGDGETPTIITEPIKDNTEEENKEVGETEQKDWKEVFKSNNGGVSEEQLKKDLENAKSVTLTGKSKGG